MKNQLPVLFMTFVLLTPVFPLEFSLLNLRARNGHYFLCKLFETLEWGFGWWRDFGRFHAMKPITQDLERNVYKRQPPTATMIKSASSNLPQSIEWRFNADDPWRALNRKWYPSFSDR